MSGLHLRNANYHMEHITIDAFIFFEHPFHQKLIILIIREQPFNEPATGSLTHLRQKTQQFICCVLRLQRRIQCIPLVRSAGVRSFRIKDPFLASQEPRDLRPLEFLLYVSHL